MASPGPFTAPARPYVLQSGPSVYRRSGRPSCLRVNAVRAYLCTYCHPASRKIVRGVPPAGRPASPPRSGRPSHVPAGPVVSRNSAGTASSGTSSGAPLLRLPAAGAEAAAGGRVRRGGHVTGEDDPLAVFAGLGVGHGHGREQRLGVGVRRVVVDLARRVPISTILPRYITPTRSEMCRTIDRSCAMKTYERSNSPCSRSSRLIDLGLHRDVERRDRLVGDDDLRVAAPARARCRCAGAGRRRTGADSG